MTLRKSEDCSSHHCHHWSCNLLPSIFCWRQSCWTYSLKSRSITQSHISIQIVVKISNQPHICRRVTKTAILLPSCALVLTGFHSLSAMAFHEWKTAVSWCQNTKLEATSDFLSACQSTPIACRSGANGNYRFTIHVLAPWVGTCWFRSFDGFDGFHSFQLQWKSHFIIIYNIESDV